MDGFRIPVGSWVDAGVDWVRDNLSGLLDVVAVVVRFLVGGLSDVLLAAPIIVVIVVAAALAFLLRSWKLAVGTVIGFALILAMGQWVTAMQTLALVLVATIVAVAISVPLGIWSARNPTVRAVLKPILDFMQTMPAFVYLIPAITFFSIGVVPGVVSTVIFALPPGVRLTELGIRGVDSETVEAGHAFGATPGQILRGIQLPLAMPTIMAGVNQVIMLALSMAVVAGIVGADGLGKEVVESISTVNLPKGVEAGLSVVVLAVYLDRLTAALGDRAGSSGSLLGVWGRRRAARAATATTASAPQTPDVTSPAEREQTPTDRTPVPAGR
ncbi:proline/glycine betaine ABC transporter permease [Microbacterium sp. lyk4-40-TSB-66]|uniref:ABC transporter permease n=1 Tax=Microbacterium sp. lyk4-40-TSB-66 TaxID=3040294 RepID=UPI00254B9648|nr:proline/glycine betaine ABC transporter permease [Microbacterium sp. lyk4-40-TSB-66]